MYIKYIEMLIHHGKWVTFLKWDWYIIFVSFDRLEALAGLLPNILLQLTPIERYAVHITEQMMEPVNEEELKIAEVRLLGNNFTSC